MDVWTTFWENLLVSLQDELNTNRPVQFHGVLEIYPSSRFIVHLDHPSGAVSMSKAER